MNNKQIQYAVELSKSLNFSQTAEKLGISQPALSKQIIGLEKELGVDLFERRSNPIALTAAGEYFLKEAEELLYKEDMLVKAMKKFKAGSLGTLNVGISPFRSLYLIPHIARKLKEKYMGVKLVLHEVGSEQLRKEAEEGKYDFAVVNLPVDESVFDVTPIEQDKLALIVPDKYINKIEGAIEKGNRINFSSCMEIPFVVVGKTQEMRQLFDKMCRSAGINPEIAMEVVGLNTAWAMACAGIGATFLPLQFVEAMGCAENVRVLIPDCEAVTRQPVIITRRGQYISEYARYAMKLLSENNN